MMRLALILSMFMATVASASTTRIEFTHPWGPGGIVLIGVLSDGVPFTSAVPVYVRPGLWYIDTHAVFGHETTLVAFNPDGFFSVPSNVRIYGGCAWDRVDAQGNLPGDGVVSLADWARYRFEYGNGEANFNEFGDFRATFQAQPVCPVTP